MYYRTNRWRQMRIWALLRDDFKCRKCEVWVTQAGKRRAEIDHIKPHKGDKALFFDMNNVQTLCKSCHSKKTRQDSVKRRVGSDGYLIPD